MSVARRREKIDPDQQDLSLTRQCQLLSISRAGLYYQALGESELNLSLMRMIGEQHLKDALSSRAAQEPQRALDEKVLADRNIHLTLLVEVCLELSLMLSGSEILVDDSSS